MCPKSEMSRETGGNKMSAEFNKAKTTGVTGSYNGSVIGKKEPLPHPVNCQNECPYGWNR